MKTMPLSRTKMMHVVHQVDLLAQGGGGVDAACDCMGVSRGTYYRYKAALGRDEPDGGQKQPKKGRPAKWALTQEEVRTLRWWAAHREGVPAALAGFANHAEEGTGTPPCPRPPAREELRAAILSHMEEAERAGRRWHPPLLLARQCRLTAQEVAAMRGQRAKMADAPIRQRTQTYITAGEDGTPVELPMFPGCGFVSDDMSLNTPFRYQDAELERATVGRQTLISRDIFSLRWLGATCIGRRKESYRVEDIADHFLDVVNFAGLPLFWRIERGPWENNWFDGVPLPPEWGETEGARWGGICELIRITRKFTPRGKGEIESGFRFLQASMVHSSTDVGRKRGEFEKAAKLFRRAKEGDRRALEYFWSMDECARALSRALGDDNATAHKREALRKRVSADALWQERPANPLPAGERWRFAPVKKCVSTRNQAVWVSAPHYPQRFQFRVTGIDLPWPTLHRGHRLFVAFHPGRPEEGAHVFNAEQADSRTNREGFRFREYLGVAPYMPPVPQEDFTGEAGDYSHQEKANAALRADFRAVVPRGTGPGTLRSTASDGLGRTLQVVSGGPDPDAAPPRKGRERAATPRRRAGEGMLEMDNERLAGAEAEEAWDAMG